MSRLLAAVGVAIMLVVVGAGVSIALQESARGTGTEYPQVNETWSPSEGDRTTLAESNRDGVVYSDADDIRVYQNDTRILERGNWSWAATNGTVKTLNGTSINSSQDATITYRYYQPTETQQALVSLGTLPVSIGAPLLILLVFAIIIAVLAAAGGGI